MSQRDVVGVIHDFIATATGLAGSLIRPRWQPTPPKQPDHNTDWCAFGITGSGFDARQLLQTTEDQATLHQQDRLEVLVSFYGPNAADYADDLRASLLIPTLRAPLRRAGLAVIDAGVAVVTPELIHDRWLMRVDLPLTLRRGSDRPVDLAAIADARVNFIKD